MGEGVKERRRVQAVPTSLHLGPRKLIFSTFGRPRDDVSTHLSLEESVVQNSITNFQNWDLNTCSTNARDTHLYTGCLMVSTTRKLGNPLRAPTLRTPRSWGYHAVTSAPGVHSPPDPAQPRHARSGRPGRTPARRASHTPLPCRLLAGASGFPWSRFWT